VFYYADEFNISWYPTLRAMWSPKGQQVMIPTPAQPTKHYGIGAVNYHHGDTVVLLKRHKRRQEIAELLEALLDKHPTGTIYVAWDNAGTHEDDEVESVLRAAAGRLVLLYLPTYSPWLNPIEMRLSPVSPRGDAQRTLPDGQGSPRSRPRLLRAL
jgi:putative transposase